MFYKWSNEARNEIATKSSPSEYTSDPSHVCASTSLLAVLFSSGDVLCDPSEDQTFLFLILRGR